MKCIVANWKVEICQCWISWQWFRPSNIVHSWYVREEFSTWTADFLWMYMVLLKWPSHIFCVFVCVCALKKYCQFYWRLFWRKMIISVIFILHCGSLNDTWEIGDRWAWPKEHLEVSYFLDLCCILSAYYGIEV